MRMISQIPPVFPVVFRPVKKREKIPGSKVADEVRGVTGVQVRAVSRRDDEPQDDEPWNDGSRDGMIDIIV
jgi:hypothetical protein